MGENSKIEWTDHTFNFWEGCTKVSPGCLHCYAETRNKRFSGGANWGLGAPRKLRSESYRREPLKWNAAAAGASRRPRVFSASLSDWLDDEVPIEWLAGLLDLIRQCENLTWLLLSKRPENWRSRLNEVRSDFAPVDSPLYSWLNDWLDDDNFPPNVWIGTSVEDQTRYDERIEHLCAIPAAIRFLSMEPMLGPVNMQLGANLPKERMLRWHRPVRSMIHWVIVGGESGPGASPMYPAWAQDIRDQCAKDRVSFFFKQWGEWGPATIEGGKVTFSHDRGVAVPCPKNPEWIDIPGGGLILRAGKHATGHMLDGVEHHEFPA